MKRRNFLAYATAFFTTPVVLAKAPAKPQPPAARPAGGSIEDFLNTEAKRISKEISAKFDPLQYQGKYTWRSFSGPGKTGAFSGKIQPKPKA